MERPDSPMWTPQSPSQLDLTTPADTTGIPLLDLRAQHIPATNWGAPPTTLGKHPRQEDEDPTGDASTPGETRSGQSSFTAGGTFRSLGSNANNRKRRRKNLEKLDAKDSKQVAEVQKWAHRMRHVRVTSYVGDLFKPRDFADGRSNLVKYKPPRYGVSFATPNPYFAEFLAETQPDLHGVDLTQHCFMTSNLDAQMNHLQHYDYDPKPAPDHIRERYEVAARMVEHELAELGQIGFPDMPDFLQIPYRKQKYPGFEYRAQGYRNRGEAHVAAAGDAANAWTTLMGGDRVDPHFVRLGGRGKVVHKSQEAAEAAGDVKGRLILMTSHRDYLVCAATEQPLNNLYKDRGCFISVGDSWYHGGSTLLYKKYSAFSKYYCFDAKKFDSSIRPWMIDRAMETLRRQFVDGEDERYDAYWAFVRETMFNTKILRDDAIIFEKFTGTTSGHNHNSIIQSIISACLFYYGLAELAPHLKPSEILANTTIKTLGDDTLPAIRDPIPPFNWYQIAAVVKRDLEIDWTGDKSYATECYLLPEELVDEAGKEEVFDTVQYLGKFFKLGNVVCEGEDNTVVLPVRPFVETLIHLFFPERPIRIEEIGRDEGGRRAYQMAVGQYVDGAGHPWSRALLDSYLDWLEVRDHHRVAEWESDTEAKFFMDYSAGRTQHVLRFRRFRYEEWLDLCAFDRETVIDMFGMDAVYDDFEDDVDYNGSPVEQ
uniref:RNA-dependent RNA polymerase n=1 Tax=Rhizoctonia cerealis orthocurvulavirus TaxID=3068670 RepID=A0AA51GGQ1_9VIRU|nr:MAG: RNA-dependent RNA polymerase [Rhizoctonia cerealis orthocurvulavirus]